MASTSATALVAALVLRIHERPFCNAYDKVLPAGSVVTDEPGIYLPGKFGIRLEDFGVVGFIYTCSPQSTHDLCRLTAGAIVALLCTEGGKSG